MYHLFFTRRPSLEDGAANYVSEDMLQHQYSYYQNVQVLSYAKALITSPISLAEVKSNPISKCPMLSFCTQIVKAGIVPIMPEMNLSPTFSPFILFAKSILRKRHE